MVPSRLLRNCGWRLGSAAAATNALGSHGRRRAAQQAPIKETEVGKAAELALAEVETGEGDQRRDDVGRGVDGDVVGDAGADERKLRAV